MDAGTKAVFRIEDANTFDVFKGCRGIDLRIEYVPTVSSLSCYFPVFPFGRGVLGSDQIIGRVEVMLGWILFD